MDILQIRKFDLCMEELDPNLADEEDQLFTIEEEEEEQFSLELERGFNCLWDEVDTVGNSIPCELNIIPNNDNTLPNYCPKHIEENKCWMDILELYVNDILKLCEPVLIKKMNKEQNGWKKLVEEQLGMTKYLITKFVNDKYKEGYLPHEISQFLDNLDE